MAEKQDRHAKRVKDPAFIKIGDSLWFQAPGGVGAYTERKPENYDQKQVERMALASYAWRNGRDASAQFAELPHIEQEVYKDHARAMIDAYSREPKQVRRIKILNSGWSERSPHKPKEQSDD